MNNVKHIVKFSGGKDSTCMLLMMLEKGMPVDEIIFCDTGMEFDEMYEHIDKVEQYIGRKITRLKAEHDFEYMMFEHERSKGKRVGQKGYSWSTMQNRWCTSYFKIGMSDEYLKHNKPYMLYIGIAYDEPKRHRNIPNNVIHPLYDWQITEQQALLTCYKHGFTWGGLYEKFKRVSCWCCPLQPISELRTLYHDFPNLWARLRELDRRTIEQFTGTEFITKFRADYSVEQLEERFKREDYLKKISIPLFDVNTDDV